MDGHKLSFEEAEAMGISHEAYDEVLDIIGHLPSVDELSTLLAMWESNGKQQSLYGWLRGQHHNVQRDEYLYSGTDDEHLQIREPKAKECLNIAHSFLSANDIIPSAPPALTTGMLLYLVGNVSSEFLGSEYAKRYLHLVDNPMATHGHDMDCRYIEMIIETLTDCDIITNFGAIGHGGIFASLLRNTAPLGFDILVPREVRLDAFLFGEEKGRYIITVAEEHDDLLLQKLTEARLNCCFLGRTTKNRVIVDGFDFGTVASFLGAIGS